MGVRPDYVDLIDVGTDSEAADPEYLPHEHSQNESDTSTATASGPDCHDGPGTGSDASTVAYDTFDRTCTVGSRRSTRTAPAAATRHGRGAPVEHESFESFVAALAESGAPAGAKPDDCVRVRLGALRSLYSLVREATAVCKDQTIDLLVQFQRMQLDRSSKLAWRALQDLSHTTLCDMTRHWSNAKLANVHDRVDYPSVNDWQMIGDNCPGVIYIDARHQKGGAVNLVNKFKEACFKGKIAKASMQKPITRLVWQCLARSKLAALQTGSKPDIKGNNVDDTRYMQWLANRPAFTIATPAAQCHAFYAMVRFHASFCHFYLPRELVDAICQRKSAPGGSTNGATGTPWSTALPDVIDADRLKNAVCALIDSAKAMPAGQKGHERVHDSIVAVYRRSDSVPVPGHPFSWSGTTPDTGLRPFVHFLGACGLTTPKARNRLDPAVVVEFIMFCDRANYIMHTLLGETKERGLPEFVAKIATAIKRAMQVVMPLHDDSCSPGQLHAFVDMLCKLFASGLADLFCLVHSVLVRNWVSVHGTMTRSTDHKSVSKHGIGASPFSTVQRAFLRAFGDTSSRQEVASDMALRVWPRSWRDRLGMAIYYYDLHCPVPRDSRVGPLVRVRACQSATSKRTLEWEWEHQDFTNKESQFNDILEKATTPTGCAMQSYMQRLLRAFEVDITPDAADVHDPLLLAMLGQASGRDSPLQVINIQSNQKFTCSASFVVRDSDDSVFKQETRARLDFLIARKDASAASHLSAKLRSTVVMVEVASNPKRLDGDARDQAALSVVMAMNACRVTQMFGAVFDVHMSHFLLFRVDWDQTSRLQLAPAPAPSRVQTVTTIGVFATRFFRFMCSVIYLLQYNFPEGICETRSALLAQRRQQPCADEPSVARDDCAFLNIAVNMLGVKYRLGRAASRRHLHEGTRPPPQHVEHAQPPGSGARQQQQSEGM